jgi:hypothetical protein
MADPRERGSVPAKEAGIERAAAPGKEENEEWIFTTKVNTGELVKIEKVDRASGQRKELSDEEYASMYGFDPSSYGWGYEDYSSYGYDPFAGYGSYAGDPYAYLNAYYQGIADYAAAVATDPSFYGYSSTEEAYYQGMADYAASL